MYHLSGVYYNARSSLPVGVATFLTFANITLSVRSKETTTTYPNYKLIKLIAL